MWCMCCVHLVSPEALDFLDGLLRYDHQVRTYRHSHAVGLFVSYRPLQARCVCCIADRSMQ
jgi:hypothetical protein